MKQASSILNVQAQRARCCPAKLSYLNDCRSKSLALSKRGFLSWTLKAYAGQTDVYAIFATVRLICMTF